MTQIDAKSNGINEHTSDFPALSPESLRKMNST